MNKHTHASPKRTLIENALSMQCRLWAIRHPSFRTAECLLWVDEALTREHIKAFAGLIGKPESSSWGSFSEKELMLYIFALKVECACYELDLLERVEMFSVLPEELA